jgi:FSR family fosmidomycin resistance protein-like MFS transporter
MPARLTPTAATLPTALAAPPRAWSPATAPPVPAADETPASAGQESRTDRHPKAHVGLLGLVHFTNDTYSCILTALLPVLLPTLGLTIGAAGALTALSQLVSAVVQPVVGYLSDRHRLRWPIWAGLALTAIGSSVVGLVPTFSILALCVVVAGIGTSLFHPVAAATVGRLAPSDRRGRWMGLYETAGWGGTVVGPLAIGLTVDRIGPAGIWPAALPALVLALIAIRLMPKAPAFASDAAVQPDESAPAAGPATGQSRLRFLGLFTTVGSLRAWVYYVAALLLPLLGHEIGLGPSGAAQVLTVYLAAGVLGSLACGTASDRLEARWIIAGALVLTVPTGLGLWLLPPNGPGLFVLAASTGFLLTGAYTGLTVAGQQRLPGDAGMVTGLNVGLTSGIGGLAVVPLASLADDIGIRAALSLALIVGPLLAAAIWLVANRRAPATAPSSA